jgi:sugar phosphate isomerase/epimerase
MLSRRALLVTPVALLATRAAFGQAGSRRMRLCLHSNTSSAAGYRGALEGWAKAGIKEVEVAANLIEAFLKGDTVDAARRVLTDNGLTPVHASVPGNLLETTPGRAALLDTLKKRLETLAFLGFTKVYTTTNSTQKPVSDQYERVAANMRELGDIARSFNMMISVEFVRASPYMSTLLTALKVTRQAAHPHFGMMFDFYHFWSGHNRLEDMDQIRNGEITHVHFQDVPDIPRETLDNNTRVIPGDGVAPIVPILKKLREKGYHGPLSVELFAPQFRDGNPYDVARQIRQKCEPLMRRAGVA